MRSASIPIGERIVRLLASSLAALALIALASTVVRADIHPVEARYLTKLDGPFYWVDEIRIVYAEEHISHPDPELLMQAWIAVGLSPAGLAAPRPGVERFELRLEDLPDMGGRRIYATAIRAITRQLVDELNRQGLSGVFVAPHAEDIDDSGRDLRAPENRVLRLVVWAGRVNRIRTIASGPSTGEVEDLERSALAFIESESPVRPSTPEDPDHDLIRTEELDAFVSRASRHPGRRVDVALTPAVESGRVYLDYLIAEDRPWHLYSQLANTGTDTTSRWRQRVGFAHHQLSGRDDILRLDYLTGSLDEVQAFRASYSAPLPWVRQGRWTLRAAASRYDAGELAFGIRNFEGEQREFAGELSTNLYQRGPLFVDLEAGVRFLNVETTNFFKADTDFLLPRVGVRAERLTATSSFRAGLWFEKSLDGVAGTDRRQVDLLGPAELDLDWSSLRWDWNLSFFVDPLLDPGLERTRHGFGGSGLVHELELGIRGQHSLGSRIIPQERMVVGGLYSVRGYPQAIASGDNVYLASLEYRYHVAAALGLESKPRQLPVLGAFRVAPQRVLGRADWDLVVRAFLDGARTAKSGSVPGEEDETLLGVGLGLELVLRRNLSLRLDFARALREAGNREVKSGDTETHFSATLLY